MRPISQRTVLIVDDSPEDRATLHRHLKHGGGETCRILEAASAKTALEYLQRETPDCVLLDYRLPDMTGLELLAILNESNCLLQFPVVMLTGSNDVALVVSIMKQGAQDYLGKDTLTGEILARAIDNAIDSHLLHRQLEEQREELKRKNAELKQQTQELDRSNTNLQQFAYVASHDLQEPLRMIASFLELLVLKYGEQLDEQAHEYINYAVDGAVRMKALINDLLAYSRIGSQAITMEPTPVDPLLREVLTDLQLQIMETGAVITSDPLPNVSACNSQLRLVLQNLISNAIKFRGAAAPRVHLSALAVDDAWRFAISDNGIGMRPQDRERIFIIFQRLHTREKYPGTGIGLAVCQRVVERHGGRIWVESEPGQGSTFYFTLPHSTAIDPEPTVSC